MTHRARTEPAAPPSDVNTVDDSNSVDPVTLDHSGDATPGHLTGGKGADHVRGGAGDDKIGGGAGDDHLLGGAGNDNEDGGTGNDSIDGGTGNDTISGAAGNDTMFGSAGADKLNGGDGRDNLAGGVGNDTLTGGGGHDLFHMGVRGGVDEITDFTVKGVNADKLDLHAAGVHFHSFDDLIKHVTQDGANAVLHLGHGNTLTLDHVDMHTLNVHDFML